MKTLRKGIKFKVLISLILCFLLFFMFCGCGDVQTNSSNSTIKVETTTKVQTAKPVETTTAQPTTKAHVTEAPTVRQTTAPTTAKIKPTEAANNGGGSGTMVYVVAEGKKYHSNPNCSNMKSPIKISIEKAKTEGYTPCKKCYR